MGKKLAVLHTSLVFIERERFLLELLGQELPGVVLQHLVDSTLLADVMAAGEVSKGEVRRFWALVRAAEEAGADLIFSTCSSLGPAVDAVEELARVPIVRIDEGMAAEAALRGRSVGVLATVPTTLGPTRSLIERQGRKLGKELEVRERLCRGAFEALMAGDVAGHDRMVAEAVRELCREVDVVVMAQASMARLGEALAGECAVPVLTSPRLAVALLRRRLLGG
jgi:Asp/Glu/hydantoin racemase